MLGGALVTALLSAGVLAAPVPWVVTTRGPTVDVLGVHEGTPVIRLDGTPATASTGQLRMVTVNVDIDVSAPQVAAAWLADDRAVMPREAVLPGGITPQDVDRRNAEAFTASQTSAEAAAERELGRTVDVTIRLDEIGGPSAGLMFALGIVDKAGPEDLTGGRVIAGTGTVDDAGVVGPIGGIPQKLRGAAADGATFFLVPAGNCAEAAANAVPGLSTVTVGTLAEAVAALLTLAAGGRPAPCPAG